MPSQDRNLRPDGSLNGVPVVSARLPGAWLAIRIRARSAACRIGFGRRVDLPGLGELRQVRVYLGRPVAAGDVGTGWRLLVGVEK